MAIRQINPGHVHLAELDFGGGRWASAGSVRQHRWAEIDAHDLGAGRIERKIPSRTHARIEYHARKSRKELRPDLAVATILERQVQDIIERRNALIALKIRGLSCPHMRLILYLPACGGGIDASVIASSARVGLILC